MKIAVVTNAKDAPFMAYDKHAKIQSHETLNAVRRALTELGYRICVLEAGPDLFSRLLDENPHAVFNIATGYRTKKDQANIAGILELAGIPFTGSGQYAHTVGLHKNVSKMLMRENGVRTPKFFTVQGPHSFPNEQEFRNIGTPVIVKPAAEGSSVGIDNDSVTEDFQKAKSLAENLLRLYGPPVLIEEFIKGREFTVAILGDKALPVEEIVFSDSPMYTYGVKSEDNVRTVCPANITLEVQKEIVTMAENAFSAIGCKDFGRVDLRLSEDEVPYAIEINTLPGLMPQYSEFPRIASEAGIGFTELVRRILEEALCRRGEERSG